MAAAVPLWPVSLRAWEDATWAHLTAAALERDAVQVWIATTPADAAHQPALVGLLSPDERMRADRFLVSAARYQFVFGRAFLRQLLGACLQIAPAPWKFTADRVASRVWSIRPGRVISVSIWRTRAHWWPSRWLAAARSAWTSSGSTI